MQKIYAFGRGNVVVGEMTLKDGWLEGTGATIRKWGTQSGLGQLADGPLSDTILDPIPHGLRIPLGSLYGEWLLSEVGQKKFAAALKKIGVSVLL
jgi:hypothetical protein